MTLVEDRFGVFAESVDDSMRTTNDLMSKYKILRHYVIWFTRTKLVRAMLLISGRKMMQFAFLEPSPESRELKLLEKVPLMGIYFKPYDLRVRFFCPLRHGNDEQ